MMIESLFSYWRETILLWHGGLGSSSIAWLAFLAWPAAVSYSALFWSYAKGKEKLAPLVPLFGGAVFLTCLILWHLGAAPEGRDWLVTAASLAVFWVAGCLFYWLTFGFRRRK